MISEIFWAFGLTLSLFALIYCNLKFLVLFHKKHPAKSICYRTDKNGHGYHDPRKNLSKIPFNY